MTHFDDEIFCSDKLYIELKYEILDNDKMKVINKMVD